MSSSINIGVLSIQGDVEENMLAAMTAIDELDVDGTVSDVNTPEDVPDLDALIIPGGESTTMGRLSADNGLLDAIRDRISEGMPVLGICAGMIMLSASAGDRVMGKTQQPLLGTLDIAVERNALGRQSQSFEAEVSMDSIGIPTFLGVFIRAPAVTDAGSAEVLARLDGRAVALKKDNIIGTSFHPELTGDVSLHKYLVNLAVISAKDK